ncbi:hypothetical protein BS17DRAFT_786217 [Gyrodon lividus]|nr:hypothetical protein BS17DRAFT_786217 [Gyrodon lividus]
MALQKSIGVSNFSVEQLQRLLKTAHDKPVVNQIELHPYNYAENKDLLAYCAKQGIVVELDHEEFRWTSRCSGAKAQPL